MKFLHYKKLLIILPLILLFSCDDKITISSEKNEIELKVIKTISFPKGFNTYRWRVVTASDGHDYMENNGGNDYVIMHYVECTKCKKL